MNDLERTKSFHGWEEAAEREEVGFPLVGAGLKGGGEDLEARERLEAVQGASEEFGGFLGADVGDEGEVVQEKGGDGCGDEGL